MSRKERKSISEKKGQHRQKEYPKQLQSGEPQKIPKYLRIPKTIVAIVSFLIAFGGFLFLIWPRISVYPNESLDPYKPFKTPFVIKNDGYLAIRSINYSFVLNKVETENYLLFENIEVGTPAVISELGPNRTSVVDLRFINRSIRTRDESKKIIDLPVKSADLHVKLTYKPYLIPYTFTDNIRFKTYIKTNGEYIWLQYHSSE